MCLFTTANVVTFYHSSRSNICGDINIISDGFVQKVVILEYGVLQGCQGIE